MQDLFNLKYIEDTVLPFDFHNITSSQSGAENLCDPKPFPPDNLGKSIL